MSRLDVVAPGVLVATSTFMATTTTVIDLGGGRAVVVDPGVHLDELASLGEELAARRLQVHAGVATHAHWDHVLWHEALGEAPRWASAGTAETVASHRQELMAEAIAVTAIDQARFARIRPLGADGVPGAEELRVVAHDAHQAGHLALHLPDRRVLIAGDMTSDLEVPLLEHGPPGPTALDRYHRGLDALATLDVDVVITGHGSPCSGSTWRRRIDDDRRYLDDLASGRVSDDVRLREQWLIDADAAMREVLTKRLWRRWAASLPELDRAHARTAATAAVSAAGAVRTGLVAAYSALPGEVDLADALGSLDVDRVALPRIDGDAVTWHRIGDGLEPHALGMLQPRSGSRAVEPGEIGVVLVPGRAFDRYGIRLGRGGGHYDRLLPQLPAGAIVIGVTTQDRVLRRLPTEAHDAPMTHLATELGVQPTQR